MLDLLLMMSALVLMLLSFITRGVVGLGMMGIATAIVLYEMLKTRRRS